MMVVVAVLLSLLSILVIVGFGFLLAKLGALSDNLQDTRDADIAYLGSQLDAVSDKLQGLRLDLVIQQKKMEHLGFQLEGPQSVRGSLIQLEGDGKGEREARSESRPVRGDHA